MNAPLPFAKPELWTALQAHANRLSTLPVTQLFAADITRFSTHSREFDGLLLDYSRQRVDAEALESLLQMAEAAGVPKRIESLFAGQVVNDTEGRPALHTALRHPSAFAAPPATAAAPLSAAGVDVRAVVSAERAKCRAFVADILNGRRFGATGQRFTDVVNIGIGGSDLGPVMAMEALQGFQNARIRTHFVSNVDGCQFADLSQKLHAAKTLFVICSKTFTTLETLTNARLARRWVEERLGNSAIPKHFAAVSVNQPAMDAFGVGPDSRFAMWDWVGGRYSLWSAIGLVIELGIGTAAFERLLAGAHAMDEHFRTAQLADSLPVLLGLMGVWNRNLLDIDTHAVLPYDQRLHRFPAYLQQLEMESLGKRVQRNGTATGWNTGPVIWGEPGNNGQHSFFQLLHQGTTHCSLDFLVPAKSSVGLQPSQDLAIANAMGQAQAFMAGYSEAEARAELQGRRLSAEQVESLAPHKVHEGSRPCSMLLFERLDPFTLGKLVALYEHKTFVQSVLWDINAFDQWGVELGKKLAERVAPAVADAKAAADLDPATQAGLEWLRGRRG